MSYRPNYPESWRPPPRRGGWRPSREQTDLGADMPWTESRERRYEEDDRLNEPRRTFPGKGDSWRPPRQQGRGSTYREGDHNQRQEDSANRTSSHRPPSSASQTFQYPTRPAVSASGFAQTNLNPSVPAFSPGDVRQYPSFNNAVPTPPRSADVSSTTTGRNSGDRVNTPSQSTAPPHRYPLRSRAQENAARSVRIEDAQIPPGQLRNFTARNIFDPTTSSNAQRPWSEHKKKTTNLVQPPPAPRATELYLAQARLPAIRSAAPKKILVVLDLNGTLLVRPNRMKAQEFRIRPGVHQLLDYLFKNHIVMFYSSARPENVKAMVDALATKKQAQSLAAIWGRDKLELTPAQYNEKVQVYKKLEKVWQDERIQATSPGKQLWNQTNTVLVDDSHLKALSQPHNLIQVPEFTKKKLDKEQKRRELEIVASVRAKLEELKWAHDVSRHIWRWQTGQLEPPRATKLSPSTQSAGAETGEHLSPMADDPFSSDTDESSGGAAIDAALEQDMQNLMTEPGAKHEIHPVNEPVISAEEWKAFLR